MQSVKCGCGNTMQVGCAVRPKTEFKKCRLADITIGCRVTCEKCGKEHVISFTYRKE